MSESTNVILNLRTSVHRKTTEVNTQHKIDNLIREVIPAEEVCSIILNIKCLSQCILPAGMPTNERAIAAAAYAAAHSRSKGCPLLGRIAHGARMEFIAGKARGSIASGPHPSNEVFAIQEMEFAQVYFLRRN